MKKLALLFFISVIFVTSCAKFDEYNTDPNQSTKVTPDLLATGLLLETFQYSHVGADFLQKDMLAKYISYMEGASDYQYNKFDRAGFGSLVKLTNVRKMQEMAAGSIYEDSYHGLGNFIRAYTFYNLTMRVGDIPYSEAVQGEDGVYNPKYDSQKEVFLGILKELEEADALFAKGRNFPGDPMFDGDVVKWRKVVNNFRLKILTHLYKKADTDAEFNVKAQFDAIVKGGAIMTSNADNLQITYSDMQVEFYPFYNSSFRKYPVMSTTIVNTMKTLNDYRLFYYAEPASFLILGGKQPNDINAYLGVNPSDSYNSISSKNANGIISGINPRYYMLPQGEPTFYLSYAEQCFIIAEGILRGWTTGDAQQFYNSGIRAAMQFVAENTPDDAAFHHGMKITPTVIDNYIAGTGVAFTANTDDNLQKIYQQRYLMGFLQDGWNTYFEYRRVGYPALPVNAATNRNITQPNKIPARWMYPDKEHQYNQANVKAAIDTQFSGNDEVNELMWILK